MAIADFLSKVFWHNSVSDYLVVLGGLVFGLLLIGIFKNIVIHKISLKFSKDIQKSFQSASKNIVRLLYLVLFYACLQFLVFPPKFVRLIDISSTLTFGVFFIYIINNLVLDYILNKYARSDSKKSGVLNSQFFASFVKFLVWIIGLLMLADNIGIKITPLIAGLGIGGVGIALASQVLLKDLFSCFAIYFDRPFGVGDFIIVGDFLGTVEHIGIKTTRLRSLGGEELILSNSDLTESRVRNYKRMAERRVLFDIKVMYTTPLEKLQLVPEAIKAIVDNIEGVRYDRAHLARFGEHGYVFEVVYYVLSSDYNKYMDVQQKINFGIVTYFDSNDIVFSNLARVLRS